MIIIINFKFGNVFNNKKWQVNVPVTIRDSLEERKETKSAMSSGVPSLPIGEICLAYYEIYFFKEYSSRRRKKKNHQ